MPNFVVREYAHIEVNDGNFVSTLDHAFVSQTAFTSILDLLSKDNYAKIFQMLGSKKLKIFQYVGIIETPCGTCIEILSKHVEDGLNKQ